MFTSTDECDARGMGDIVPTPTSMLSKFPCKLIEAGPPKNIQFRMDGWLRFLRPDRLLEDGFENLGEEKEDL